MRYFLIMLVSISAFSKEPMVKPKIAKMRKDHPEQWKECMDSYKKYMTPIREKVKKNKRVSSDEMKEMDKELKPYLEPLFVCQSEGYFTDREMDNVVGAGVCLTFYAGAPSTAKNQDECKNLMKPDSF